MHTPRLLIIKFYNNSLNNYFPYVVSYMTSISFPLCIGVFEGCKEGLCPSKMFSYPPYNFDDGAQEETASRVKRGSMHYMHRAIIACSSIFSYLFTMGYSRAGLAGPRSSQMLAVTCHWDWIRLRYSNRTVMYSNKAFGRPGCAHPTLPSLSFQANSTEKPTINHTNSACE